MSEMLNTLEQTALSEYKYGWVTDIEADEAPPGLSEDIVRFISAKKNEPEWMLEWRLKAYRHWLKMTEPEWANVHYTKPDFNALAYYSAPKSMQDGPKSLDEVDPKLLAAKDRIDGETVLNMAVSSDTIGGSSGSPVVNAAGEILGANFDSTVLTQRNAYGYDRNVNRSVIVTTQAVTVALRDVYGMDHLIQELGVAPKAARSMVASKSPPQTSRLSIGLW